ncbi:MAG: alpha-galactosidase, partial [Oscillospiraceae bacterium]|nr:alpha-galactosidase [Oscillospiraceae bacterium]
DYALQTPGRSPTLSRNQYVLDLTRREVRDCVYDQISSVLRSAPIVYLKWDMNRVLTDVFSSSLPAGRQGETAHRYTLGLYELQERLLSDFPDLLLENCCSGGGRFDAGMLYYSPQIWTSDNAEAIDRLLIQEGTALVYPLSSMGAHIAVCPSHTNHRSTPFRTRGLVSLAGCFGYELDLNKLTPEEFSMIPEQLAEYHEFGPVFRDGDAYRLASFSENHSYDALLAVAKDQSLAVLSYVQVISRVQQRSLTQQRSLRLPLAGLDAARLYRNRQTGETRSGAGWMHGGILLPVLEGDFQGLLTVLESFD